MSQPPYTATIRSLRTARGFTQEELAALAKTSARTIRAIEAGTGNPGAATLIRIFDALRADRDHRGAAMGAK